MLSGKEQAGPVTIDGATFQDPVGLCEGKGSAACQPFANAVVTGKIVLSSPAVEAESLSAPRRAGFEHDRTGVAKPDVAERLYDYPRERSEPPSLCRSVVVCKTADRVTCGGDEIEFDAGWIVFVNTDDRLPPARGASEPLLLAYSPATEGTVVSYRPFYEFRAYRRRSTNGTVTFCDARGPPAARAVIVSYTGRPRTAVVGPGDRPLICARLP